MSMVLVTGSAGLIGSALSVRLRARGDDVRTLDLRDAATPRDVLDERALESVMDGCDGVVHLAAVSRVVWGERDPARCLEVNVEGTRRVLRAASRARAGEGAGVRRPWVVVASSREVYGEPSGHVPLTEDAPIHPINVYGRSKAECESMAISAREAGVRTAVVRLSNVYGATTDHPDRVVPAFCRGAARGEALRLDGADHVFDFVHVDDATAGIERLCEALAREATGLPPVHLVTGRGTTLGELARLAMAVGDAGTRVIEAPPRDYDVGWFIGDPARARALLGWSAGVTIEQGTAGLVAAFRAQRAT